MASELQTLGEYIDWQLSITSTVCNVVNVMALLVTSVLLHFFVPLIENCLVTVNTLKNILSLIVDLTYLSIFYSCVHVNILLFIVCTFAYGTNVILCSVVC